jgi:hypothetical protein
MPAPKPLSREDILRAMKFTKSNRAAARYLGVSYQHYKPWAKSYKVEALDPDSISLFESHKNPSGKGIPKFLPNRKKYPNIKNIIETGTGWESFTPDKIKARLIAESYLKEECHKCGFNERRITDYKIPLLLNFKDRNKYNYFHNNLELLCYNCYFLYVADPLTPDNIRNIEDTIEIKSKEFDWEIDEDHIENLKSLGLWEEDSEPGSEFISYKK